MKAQLRWIKNMNFEAEAAGNKVFMDAKTPIGQGLAMTPKEFVASGLGGCTAMDVVALLKKHKQDLKSLDVSIDVDYSTGTHPVVFTHALIKFTATGSVDENILIEAVQLSQTKYCGVSAMLSKIFPIEWIVELNGKELGRGKASF